MADAADRTAHLLALMVERSPRTIAELIAGADAPAADVELSLAALERHGLIEWDAGRAQVRFAHAARRDLAELAEPAMRRLADESGETVNLMVRSPHGAEAIAQVDGRHVLGVSSWIGREVPDHCSAAGKVFLAFGASPLREPLERLTARTIVHPDQLERDLGAVREHGFATIVDELEMGLGPSRLGIVGRLAVEQADAVSAQLR
jgi:DNA-binding IclR family transcriptional regulator